MVPSGFTPSATAGDAPDKKLQLEYVYGYQGRKGRDNVIRLPSGEVLYYIAAVGIALNETSNTQRFYLGHDNDIQSIAVHPSEHVAASGQQAGATASIVKAHIRVWNYDTMEDVKIFGAGAIDGSPHNLSFSPKHGNVLVSSVPLFSLSSMSS